MNLDIVNKVFFITGSSRGIGNGIAKVLLSEGCRVIINGRDVKCLEAEIKKLNKDYPDKIISVEGDVNKTVVTKEVIKKSIDKWGTIDGIVANAGAVKRVPDWEINKDDWNWFFNNNFSVAYNAIQSIVPILTKSRGSIVTIGSIASLEDVGAPLPYSSSKAALLTYTKSLSKRLADKKIRVNMVSPGNILFPDGNWDKKQKIDKDGIEKMLNTKVPLKRFGTPEDIGNMVAFLLSPRASFITGANFVVDGGQSIYLN